MSDSAIKPAGVSDRVWDLYRGSIVIDMHNDMPTKVLDDDYDPGQRHTCAEGHTDVPRLVESGLTAQWFAAWVGATYATMEPDGSFARALVSIDVVHALVRRHPDTLLAATTAADVRRAKQVGKIAIGIGVEGGHAIEGSLDKLHTLYTRGARYLTLTWNNGNPWAGSSIGVGGTRTGGLTEFGRGVIREMNRLGMLVDVSHVSDATFADVLDTSSVPVIASHSSARALSDHPRNLRDHQLRALAARGGVVCINFYPRFIDDRYRHDVEVADAELAAATPAKSPVANEPGVERAHAARVARLAAIAPVPLRVLVDHIDHVAHVAGIDHVGLGSDFDGISAVPAQMEDVTAFARIAQALVDRGYDDTSVSKILGGNVLRLLGDVLTADPAPSSR
ncbi:MAG TPA: dipeptidase [Gemmatimonadaceae bacterium]|nr:dipeptidase [Gemmatimonadaceae bacterium]